MELDECKRQSLRRKPWPWSSGLTNRLSRWRESWGLIPPPYVGGDGNARRRQARWNGRGAQRRRFNYDGSWNGYVWSATS